MQTKEKKIFESNNFALEVISTGSYVDSGCGNGKLYQVEVTTVRLNHVAYNEWLFCHNTPTRDCYETAAEWEAAKMKNVNRFEAWTWNILADLGVKPSDNNSVSISNAQSEVFTVVRIWEITAEGVDE